MTLPCQVLLVVDDLWMPATDDEVQSNGMHPLLGVNRFADEMTVDALVSSRVIALGDLSREPTANRDHALFLAYGELGAAAAIAGALSLTVSSAERRTFYMAARRRQDAISTLERTGGPGCIESHRLFTWETTTPEDDFPYGVFGRKDVARTIDARWEKAALWESEQYAMLSHDGYRTLPRLLAAYLAAFASTGR